MPYELNSTSGSNVPPIYKLLLMCQQVDLKWALTDPWSIDLTYIRI